MHPFHATLLRRCVLWFLVKKHILHICICFTEELMVRTENLREPAKEHLSRYIWHPACYALAA